MNSGNLEFKSGGLAVSQGAAAPDGSYEIMGIAAGIGNVDLQGDRILRGAFLGTLRRRPMIPLLWQHNKEMPIGGVRQMVEASDGLYFRAHILPTTQGKDAAILVRGGALSGVSIGYETKKSCPDGTGVRELQEIELYEVSLVTFPANERARVGLVGQARAIADVLSVATLDDALARKEILPTLWLQEYAAAQTRIIERMQYDGLTWDEYRRRALAELERLLRE